MAKLKLQPNPTFNLLVSIPIAGQIENDDVQFKVKALSNSALLDLGKNSDDYTFTDFVKDVVVGWDLDAAFTPQNLLLLLDNYPQAALLINKAYLNEFYKEAEKN